MKIQADIQNLGACSKLRRMSKISAEKLCGIVKFMRHIIYARTKVDVEISASDENYCAYQKIRRPSCAPAYYLGSAESPTADFLQVWLKSLVQVMSPLVHVDLKWSEGSGRPAFMGGVSPVLYRLLYRHDLSKFLRIVRISACAWIFTISYGKFKNLSRLLSVLSLHRKFVHNHNCCPNSAATLPSS